MADSLSNMKWKMKACSLAFASPQGLNHMDTLSRVNAEGLATSLNITDTETIEKLCEMLEMVLSIRIMLSDRDRGACTVEEWAESHCKAIIKQPRKTASKWIYWFTGVFDISDRDHDGYINKETFNTLYQGTRRQDDKAFLDRAFSSIDTSNTGMMSKEQFVDAFMKYMTDPDVTYDQSPLY